jgi:DNA-3-methyladenine glycosylase II
VDSDLGGVIGRLGPPPLWDRPPGFPTLVHIILEQQVSLASARAAFDKLELALGTIQPRDFLTLDDATLKRIGFSRQKARSCRELARVIDDRELDLEALRRLTDDEVRAALESVTGIGPWTSGIYLLMALRRPDVWPAGDLALAAAVRDLKGLAERPTESELLETAEHWRPWRSVAARILWNHYLHPP